MKLKVQKQGTEEVEVELPFYYAHYLDHSTSYGRVSEDRYLTVHENDEDLGFEIEERIEHPNMSTCYLKHLSDKDTFDSALERAQKWVASL
jgi:hypothetical protein